MAGNTDYTGDRLNASRPLERKLRLLGKRPEDNNINIIIRGKHCFNGMSSRTLKQNALKDFGGKDGIDIYRTGRNWIIFLFLSTSAL